MKSTTIGSLIGAAAQLSLAAPQIQWGGGFEGPFGFGNFACNLCPSTFCVGSNQCECENLAALQCYVISLHNCIPRGATRGGPIIQSCGSGQNPIGSGSSQYPACGRDLPACGGGSRCETGLISGCIDITGQGNCIGYCIPTVSGPAPVGPSGPQTSGGAPDPGYNTPQGSPPAPPTPPSPPPAPPTPPQPAAGGSCNVTRNGSDCYSGTPVCVANPIAPEGASVPGVCVSPAVQCGGTAYTSCPQSDVCVDDPRDNCDPDAGDQGCLGICIARR